MLHIPFIPVLSSQAPRHGDAGSLTQCHRPHPRVNGRGRLVAWYVLGPTRAFVGRREEMSTTPPHLGLTRPIPLLLHVVLDLSYNQLADIPFSFLARLTEMLYLDLGHNRLKELPPQFRRFDATIRRNLAPSIPPSSARHPSLSFFVSCRLANLRTLILNHNPLKFEKLSVRFALYPPHSIRSPCELSDSPCFPACCSCPPAETRESG